MADNDKIAIITGGASGIGLAVGESLSARKGWTIYLLDRDEAKGQAAARRLGTHFYKVDVAVYASLASAFTSIFAAHGKLNFVFANAGIALDPEAQHAQAPTEMLDDMENETLDGPPEAPSMDMIAVNLHSVIYTTVLAQHYFRKCSADDGPRGIVITASSASLYASATAPMYSASKHGVLGWMRSIAANAWRQDRVAVNAICPGIVQTNILPAEMYKMFPEQMLTPIYKVVEVVLMLLDGDTIMTKGDVLPFGHAVEICGVNHYYREQAAFCDENMAAIMGAG